MKYKRMRDDMIVYNILLLYIFIISILFGKNLKLKKQKIIYLFLSFVPITLVMGLRTKYVGTDTYSYCAYFREISNSTFKNAIDNNPVIWVVLNKFFALFGTKDINYILPLSVLISFFVAKFIYDNSENLKISVILYIIGYFYFSAFNVARQFLAMAISINSYKYLVNKNIDKRILKFIIVNLIAIGIHPTSIIFLICFMLLMKPTKRNIIKVFSIAIVALIAFVPISNILVKYFPHYSMYVNENGITNTGFGIGKNRNFIITIIYMTFEAIMFYLFSNNKDEKEKRNLFNFIIINGLAIFLGIMSLKSVMFSRIAWYFTIFSIIYIPYIFKYIKANQRMPIEIMYIIIMIIPYYVQLKDNISGVLPYYFNF